MISRILKNAFDPLFEAPIEAWESFAELCEEKEYKKGTVLKKSHDRETYFYFIIKGSAGVFLWKENNPVCLDFAFESHFFADYVSLLTGQATPLETITLEPSLLLRISRDNYLKLGQNDIGLIITKMAAEASYISKQMQQIDLLTKTAEQRYIELLMRQPDVVARVPQKHIASYLGITPESISRIRRKIM
jgi:CRP-like cAMP-binding protein